MNVLFLGDNTSNIDCVSNSCNCKSFYFWLLLFNIFLIKHYINKDTYFFQNVKPTAELINSGNGLSAKCSLKCPDNLNCSNYLYSYLNSQNKADKSQGTAQGSIYGYSIFGWLFKYNAYFWIGAGNGYQPRNFYQIFILFKI